MVRRGQQVKLLEAVLLHLAQLGDDFIGSADHTSCPNRLGRYEPTLIWLHEGAMAVVDLAKASALRQAVVLDPLKVALPYIGKMRRNQRVVPALFQPDLIEEMQLASHPRAGFVDYPLGSQFLAGPEHAACGQHGGVKIR